MVAVDTSTIIAFLQGQSGVDVDALDASSANGALFVPAVVLSETLSEPALPERHRSLILQLPVLDITDGYWIRAASTHATLLKLKLRARLPDVLIAQSCIDHDVALITRDRGFRQFENHCGLKLV